MRPLLFSACSREILCVYLGSIAHDVPYYYRGGHHPFEQVSDKLHGKNGEDTFDIIRSLTRGILARPPQEQITLWPFLFGMLTHIATDSVFHPAVFYFTGNYNDQDAARRAQAQARHRLFEVYLDSWLKPESRFEWGYYVKSLLLANREQNNDLICELLEEAASLTALGLHDPKKPDTEPHWKSGFKQYGIIQRLFLSNAAGALMKLLAAASRGKLTGIEALFSLGREPNVFFESPLEYKNPVTGQEFKATVDELLQQSIDRSAEYITLFDPLVSGESNDIDAVLGGVVGPSLNYGTTHSKAEDGVFYSPEGVPLKGLGG